MGQTEEREGIIHSPLFHRVHLPCSDLDRLAILIPTACRIDCSAPADRLSQYWWHRSLDMGLALELGFNQSEMASGRGGGSGVEGSIVCWEGQPPLIPGPLIQAPEDSEIHVAVRNGYLSDLGNTTI